MKPIKLLLTITLLSVAGLGQAWDGHGHARHGGHFESHFGVVIGPYWSPGFYPSPYYYAPYFPPYYPPVAVERYNPPVYIEQPAQTLPPPSTATAPAPVPQANYWYYCGASKAYYPYVQACPSGWQKVSPRPPGQP